MKIRISVGLGSLAVACSPPPVTAAPEEVVVDSAPASETTPAEPRVHSVRSSSHLAHAELRIPSDAGVVLSDGEVVKLRALFEGHAMTLLEFRAGPQSGRPAGAGPSMAPKALRRAESHVHDWMARWPGPALAVVSVHPSQASLQGVEVGDVHPHLHAFDPGGALALRMNLPRLPSLWLVDSASRIVLGQTWEPAGFETMASELRRRLGPGRDHAGDELSCGGSAG